MLINWCQRNRVKFPPQSVIKFAYANARAATRMSSVRFSASTRTTAYPVAKVVHSTWRERLSGCER
jgi:hypothetical protein